jgi:transposase-like protein
VRSSQGPLRRMRSHSVSRAVSVSDASARAITQRGLSESISLRLAGVALHLHLQRFLNFVRSRSSSFRGVQASLFRQRSLQHPTCLPCGRTFPRRDEVPLPRSPETFKFSSSHATTSSWVLAQAQRVLRGAHHEFCAKQKSISPRK